MCVFIKLRSQQRMLKRRLKEAPILERSGLQNILNDIQKRILISKAENQKNIERKSVMLGDHSTQILLLSQKDFSWNQRVANLMGMTYSDDLNGITIPPLRDLPKSQDPTVMFDDSVIKLKEVRDFVHKNRPGSAPGMNGISYKLYKNCPRVLKKLTVLLQQAWKKGIVPRELCLADGIWISKEMQSRGITNFRPISLLNVEGKILF